MKANEAPERIYCESDGLGNIVKVHNIKWPDDEAENIEYTRTDAFIEKASEFLYNYNQKQVLKHGARATLGCGEYTINVEEFKKYMEGDKV